MFDLTTYVKKWRILQLKTVFSTLDTLCQEEPSLLNSIFYAYLASTNSGSSVRLISDSLINLPPR